MKTFLLVFLVAVNLAHAESAGVPVTFRMKGGKESEMVLLGREGDRLLMHMKGAETAKTKMEISKILETRFVYPATVKQAEQAYNQNQLDKAAFLLEPTVNSWLPYLDLPANNAVPLVMTLADIFRHTNKVKEAQDLFSKVSKLSKSTDTVRATMWVAYCHAAQDQVEEAAKILETMEPPERGSEQFSMAQLIRARLQLSKKNYHAALEEITQGIAFPRIESDLFPECLFISAECYAAIAATQQTSQPSSENTGGVQLILGSTNLTQVAQNLYLEIATNFPDTPWAKKSQSKIQRSMPPVKAGGSEGAKPSSKEH